MDIFVHNVPRHVTQRQLRACFEEPLKECGILDFHCQLPRGQAFAFLTILDPSAGQRFLSFYGAPKSAPRPQKPTKIITCAGNQLRCEPSRKKPSEYDLKVLEHEASQRMAAKVVTVPQEKWRTTRFQLSRIHCGVWDYDEDSQLTYHSHFTLEKPGTITFGRQQAIVLLGPVGSDQNRMDIDYYGCKYIVLGDHRDATVTFTLSHSPKFYIFSGEDVLKAGLRALTLGSKAGRHGSIFKSRVLGLNDDHQKIAGTCRVYQFRLTDEDMLPKIRSLLNGDARMPASFSLATTLHYPLVTLETAFFRLDNELTDTARYGNMPFHIRFQLERVARNGYLSPLKVIELLPTVEEIWKTIGEEQASYALRKLVRHLPTPGPDTHGDFAVTSLKDCIRDHAGSYDSSAPDNAYELVKKHQHINLVHRVLVTPTGIYLEGPDAEPTNRVLRRYADHTDHFVRVILMDEDGGWVHYDSRASQNIVYDERFRKLLTKRISIAGRGFHFFGFSNSGLRAHSCWFMAPLIINGDLSFASNILRELGDFEMIRTPAKCAARIGQNFTDTNDTVDLDPSTVGMLPLVTRNGYDFGDGVGTISQDLLTKIWKVYGTKRLLNPTALQIRFQGTKGMVALDSRLWGEKLLLRANMTKYQTTSSWKLEICGAAFKPLPMFLNRQLIKILEDLKIPAEVFYDLQDAAMGRLRFMTESSINTSLFLRHSVSRATDVHSLIRYLSEIGLDYHHDPFLYSVVEMAVVNELRGLKYRGRLPVKDGMTLYGIMDETGYLREGEIFVITEQQAVPAATSELNGTELALGGKQVLVQNNVVITRSPAMHPGDVQLVHAVDVPEDSPLQRLRNVIVFSQHGDRDLPSQLSGGDLDGDLYNVMYDRRLCPDNTYIAAEYPRLKPVELDRPVTAKDMSDFFVTFMETDQLGVLCNTHLQLADQRPLGTLDKDCVKVARMASTAVDFSKTGIAADMKEVPRFNRFRPDFMAPSPRVMVSEKGELRFEDLYADEDYFFEAIDEEKKQVRYYKSEKVLGHLYRKIDEKQFLADMQEHHHATLRKKAITQGLIFKLCDYVLDQAKMCGVIYENYMDLARIIRAGYEDSLIDILYAHSPTVYSPLSEAEAFAGTVLGKQGGAQGKPLRELSKSMRERFDAVAEHTIMRIVNGDEAMHSVEYLDSLYDVPERVIEAWPRAIACLVVACNEKGAEDFRIGEIKSFKYIAAAVCLKEFDRTRNGLGTYGSLPRCE